MKIPKLCARQRWVLFVVFGFLLPTYYEGSKFDPDTLEGEYHSSQQALRINPHS